MISVVMPVCNEEAVLPTLYERFTRAAEGWHLPYEVIAVDDGSTDDSPALLAKIHQSDPRWKIVRFSRNFGHQAAISAGLKFAQGDAIAIIDSDLQDPPEIISHFIAKWRLGHEVVYGVRTGRKEGPIKRLAYAVFYRLLRATAAVDIPLDSGDFCLMDRRVVDVINALPERCRFVRGLRSWAGFRQVGVPYSRDARFAGEVKYTFAKLARLALDGLFGFSRFPLKLATSMGIGVAGISAAAFGLPPCVWWLSGWALPPGLVIAVWLGLSLMLALLSIQFLLLGILGEYLARIFEETQGRPGWVVAHTFGLETMSRGWSKAA